MKPRSFVVTWPVNVEHLDRVFEPAIYPAKPNSKDQKKGPLKKDTGTGGILCGVDVKREAVRGDLSFSVVHDRIRRSELQNVSMSHSQRS